MAGADLVWDNSTAGWLADKPNKLSEYISEKNGSLYVYVGVREKDSDVRSYSLMGNALTVAMTPRGFPRKELNEVYL